jgi:hypothetical protein
MLEGKWATRAVLIALAASMMSFAVLLRPVPVRGDSIACSLEDDSRPRSGATCAYELGSSCYVCDYAYDGGAEVVCSETPDGETSFCKPWDDGVPGPPKY